MTLTPTNVYRSHAEKVASIGAYILPDLYDTNPNRNHFLGFRIYE